MCLEALKPKELNPKEAIPVEYDNYFLNRMIEIRKSFKRIIFLNLIYNFTDSNLALISFIRFKGQIIFLKVYIMVI